ncbi:carboxylating nicotinate-nucleotide diphosphorylase [bacterium]|nr:carboxylating nicotinate-nucleotide diphosphorylase [bacterium]
MLNNFSIDEHIKSALKEDIPFWDITTDYVTEKNDTMTVYLRTRQDGVLAGIKVFKRVFEILDEGVKVELYFEDGQKIVKGDVLAKIEGSANAILKGERTALNYAQRMSGIATETAKYKVAIGDNSAKIVDTRKTTPNFRLFEKYSVLMGGGSLHRFNLTDCVMLKDNHIAFVGSIKGAVEKVREKLSHAHKIEVECDTLKQVYEALECGVDIIMLDYMNLEQVREACEIIAGRAVVEVSGNVTLESISKIAECGVDIISSSAIVAKAYPLDLGLDK